MLRKGSRLLISAMTQALMVPAFEHAAGTNSRTPSVCSCSNPAMKHRLLCTSPFCVITEGIPPLGCTTRCRRPLSMGISPFLVNTVATLHLPHLLETAKASTVATKTRIMVPSAPPCTNRDTSPRMVTDDDDDDVILQATDCLNGTLFLVACSILHLLPFSLCDADALSIGPSVPSVLLLNSLSAGLWSPFIASSNPTRHDGQWPPISPPTATLHSVTPAFL